MELAGSVSGLTAYAYGETSLQQTIVGLAQNFVGSNNLNCLEPSGNFRLNGCANSWKQAGRNRSTTFFRKDSRRSLTGYRQTSIRPSASVPGNWLTRLR